MEEASVAGESPDRSRQRESSEQPTSGSAGPVPEARSESARERLDPRLAVAREAAKPSTEPRRAADTATKVFSVREAAAEGADGDAGRADARGGQDGRDGAGDGGGASEASASAEDAAGAADAADGRSADDATRDGRLREAVAAWVASADTDKDADKDADRGRSSEKAGEGAQGAPEAPEASRDGADDDADGSAPEDADGDRVTPAPATTAKDDAEDEAPEADAGAEADEAPAADTTDGASEEAEPEDAVRGTGTGTGAQDGTPEADTDGGAPRSGADTDAEPEDAEPATGGAEPESPEDTDDADDADGSGGKPGARRVDQPTAVFKAVRPAVDQPTTMLKLGDAAERGSDGKPASGAKPGSKSGSKPGPAPQPGAEDNAKAEPPGSGPVADAERTSRFVALRPLDGPRPAADATRPVPQFGPERTTQQPLPPKPPLDLLAELTNTPPPPETPLRTLVRRVKIWTPLVLLLVIVFAVVQSVRPLPQPTLDLTAQDGYTFDGGKVEIPWPTAGQAALDVQGIGSFGSSGEQKPVPIASVAKVMTAYLILRDHPLKSGAEGPKIKIDQTAEDQSEAGQESTVKVTAGDAITEREAVESILIASANNVARLLARWDAGSEKAFVAKMNDAAKDLGMTNTTYTDPSGLNNTTVSTAVDQVKLAKAAMKQPVFREVAAMMSYDDYKGVNHSNWNQLVGHNGVVGIKTGTTTSALGNLVFAAKKEIGGETRTIVGAVVRQPAGGTDNTILSAALTAGDRLIRAAQDALESATILKKGTVVGYADDGLGGRTPVAVTEDVKAVGWAGLSVKLTFAGTDLPHTAKAGTVVGTLTVGDGTSSAVKVPVALQADLVEPGFTDKLTRIT
ncbi:D-alanyl-D-alanine carboxypeptidase [Streptomyces sp. DH24]|uniref:D-alanyl-D-alanine carboxypeptidase n=1 Tax=Streptomyces sp. DH24 TaxID=3040123 RepID=UPI0024420A48|nr:D-alanyl-D-alanine carboxypeptidase [Streptomyces sp. DH24]MDG9719981.1 D-alanyl-D-alanine carboxypeptidase [Streptomyces sp. DH24]